MNKIIGIKDNKIYFTCAIIVLVVSTIFYIAIFPSPSGGIYSASEFGSNVLKSDFFPPFSSLIYTSTKQSSSGEFLDSESLNKKGFGFGTVRDGTSVYVFLVLPNSPAEQAGLSEGDQILFIDYFPVEKMSEVEVNKAIDDNDSIILSVLHYGKKEPVEIKVTKSDIQLPSSYDDYFQKVNYMSGTDSSESSMPDYIKQLIKDSQDVVNDVEYDVELSKLAILFGSIAWLIIELVSLYFILKVLKWSLNFKGKLSKTRSISLLIFSVIFITAFFVFISYFFPLFHTLIKMGKELEGGWIDLSDLLFVAGFIVLIIINLPTIIWKFFIERRSLLFN